MVISHIPGKDLHLAAQAAEGRRMENPIAVPLERTAIRVLGLRMLSPLSIARMHRIAGKQSLLALLPIRSRIAKVGLLHLKIAFSWVLHYRQVVSMDDLFVRALAQDLGDPIRMASANHLHLLGIVIAQTPGDLSSRSVYQRHNVPFAKIAGDLQDPDGQQTA
jgi:hypothetical protein